ncbi:uncharacterized protein LOC125214752 isoform X1 [Salvia hispanica]|uniref:uncharacterized protein LOC125214752 isoform X1 n=1 Tax=Salvia hispanica TaxID=49212 RepID=UPI00200966C5|nr:uncharacterized protein LOC125214752 isoform X1 [Salvia hispanica]
MKPSGGSLTAAPQFSLPKAPQFWIQNGVFRLTADLKPLRRRRFSLRVSCRSGNSSGTTAPLPHTSQFGDLAPETQSGVESLSFEVRSPFSPHNLIPRPRLSLSDQAFFLLTFIGCTTSVAFACLVAAAVPTLFAMRRAAISLSKLADTAREELPSTMAAVRLSGMEISDLTLELSDLSQEITEGVNKSAQVVQAAEAGARQIGSLAREQTMAMIQERASLPIISLQPVVAGAAKKTSRVVGKAAKTFLNYISPGEYSSADEYETES